MTMACKNELYALDALLDLNGLRYVVDDELGLWVKFEVTRVNKSTERPHGIRYNLTLHDSTNCQILGFDNAHAVLSSVNRHGKLKAFDHWHYNSGDMGRPYKFINAATLLEDYWKAVDDKIQIIKNEL